MVISSAGEVRALFARLALGPPPAARVIGTITLTNHQAEAAERIRGILADGRGAFLCDVVGSGKTYIACAVAHAFENVIIVAPAALREMWRAAMAASGTRARFVTTESLSRRAPRVDHAGCLIVDEAHHFRNPRTHRYRALARLVNERPILLITATPIHNSRRDLESLGALFLGSRAASLSEDDFAGFIVRRDKSRVSMAIGIPRIAPTEWLPVGDDPDTVAALMSLPPPIPVRNAGDAAQLVAHGLIRQWASSEAALSSALRRRLGRTYSLESSLEAGEYPDERELRSWLAGEDAVQLGFPGLLGPDAKCANRNLLHAVRRHGAALRSIADRAPSAALDQVRADHLRQLTIRFPGERIIAFASYDATVQDLFRRLNQCGHIAALTSHGGRVAGGRLSRLEIISQFSPNRPPIRSAERIDLLLTTDLLSEGINLQRASIVVHLDIPWTPARLEQRVGRVARAGSPHHVVRVFAFRPPESAETTLRTSALIAAKWRAAATIIGSDQDSRGQRTIEKTARAGPELDDAIRASIEQWRDQGETMLASTTVVGAASSKLSGFIALLEVDGEPVILASVEGTPSTSLSIIHRAVSNARGPSVEVDPTRAQDSVNRVREWIARRESTKAAGLIRAPSLRSRQKLFARIDSLSARMAPHERVSRAGLILRARRTAGSLQGAWGEEQMDSLARTECSDYHWLERLTEIESNQADVVSTSSGSNIRALLLLVGPTPALS